MKKLSSDNLIDLAALNRVLRSADTIVWGIEDGFHYISDAYMAVKIRFDEPPKALVSRFDGDTPPEGAALRSIKQNKGYATDIIPLDSMKICLAEDTVAGANYTRMMYQDEYDRTLGVFFVQDGRVAIDYIFLNMAFVECVNMSSAIGAVSQDSKSPVMFYRGDEVAVILPVVVKHLPAFLAPLN